MNHWKILLACCALFFAACSSTRKTTASTYNLDTLTVSANNNPLDMYRESAPVTWDILHTQVALSFDLNARTAGGVATLTLQPYCCAQDSVVLDAKGMEIKTVAEVVGTGHIPLRFSYQEQKLIIYKKSTEAITLRIAYKAMPYADSASGGSAAISDDRGLYFINTDNEIPGKPSQIWTQGESESNSHWLPTIDKPNERFTIQMDLTVPDSFITLGNGALIVSKPAGNGLRIDSWRIDKPIQTYAAMFAIGKYAIIKDNWSNKEVSYYVEPEYGAYAKRIFNHTPEMLDYFSTITGVSYPWNKYSQVVARDYVSGAMENTTASLFGEFVNKNDRELDDRNNDDIVAHELFHQWFGDYVTFESWSNLTLSESFANYSEQLWRKHFYGDASADELAYDDLNNYLAGTKQADPDLVRFHYGDREEMFDHISYNKGGAILNYLKGLVGERLFFKSMNIYLTENALQSAEATQWRLAVEKATGRDWNWFFNEFYYRGGHPVLDIKYQFDDPAQQLVVTVRQRSSPDSNTRYQLPLKAGIVQDGAVTIVDWSIKKRTEIFTYKYQQGKCPVVVPDYYHWLPGEILEQKTPAQALAQFQACGDYINKRRALGIAYKNFQDTASQALFAAALHDSLAAIRMNALTFLAKKPLQETHRPQVAFMAVQDASNRVRAAAFDCLGEWKIATMKNELMTAIDDRSYAVSGSALNALYVVDKQAGYDKAKLFLGQDPKARQEQAVWSTIAANGSDTDLYVFRDKADKVYGTRRVDLASYLSQYLAAVKDQKTFDEGLDLLHHIFTAENIPNYKSWIFAVVVQNLGAMRSGRLPKPEAAVAKTRKAAAKKVLSSWIEALPEPARNHAMLEEQFK